MPNNPAADLARQRWAKAKANTIICDVCGATKETLSGRAKYCSNACKQKAKRQREKARGRL